MYIRSLRIRDMGLKELNVTFLVIRSNVKIKG